MIVPRTAEWGVLALGVALAATILSSSLDPRVITVIVTLAVAGVAVWIVWQDILTFTIADSAILTIAVLAFAARWSCADAAFEPALTTAIRLLLDAIVPGGLLYMFREIYYRRKGFDGLGFGDVKLAAAGGLLVGTEGFFWALAVASCLALLYVVAARWLSDAKVDGLERLAFGAVLAPTFWGVWVLQQMPLLLPSATS